MMKDMHDKEKEILETEAKTKIETRRVALDKYKQVQTSFFLPQKNLQEFFRRPSKKAHMQYIFCGMKHMHCIVRDENSFEYFASSL